MRTSLIRVGDARGICIPEDFIREAGIGEVVNLTAEGGRLIVEAEPSGRKGWAEALAALAERGDDLALFGEVGNTFARK